MLLKFSVFIASFAQVFAAAFLSIGTFQDAERLLPVYIQPTGWTFSIWGVIYSLSFIYGIYQMIPRYDNAILSVTRIPALYGFVGSGVWLYFAGQNNLSVWMTIPVLFSMAFMFLRVVNVRSAESKISTILSKRILLPYAAWTGVACWVNVQALLIEERVITDSTVNFISNGFLLGGLIIFVMGSFKKTAYDPWYGVVIVWASMGIFFANLFDGSTVFALSAFLLAAYALVLMVTKKRI